VEEGTEKEGQQTVLNFPLFLCLFVNINPYQNPNPIIVLQPRSSVRRRTHAQSLWLEDDETTATADEGNDVEPIDVDEVFDLIRDINDPEHPNTLEELLVVSASQITIKGRIVRVEFTPTVPHCGLSNTIGLCLQARLIRCLPSNFKIEVVVKPGSHLSEHALNRQLNDKERVAAALENPGLVKQVEDCFTSIGQRSH